MVRAQRHAAWVALLLLLPFASWLSSSGGCPCLFTKPGVAMMCPATCPMMAGGKSGIMICGAKGGPAMTCCMSSNAGQLTLPASLMPVVPPVSAANGAAVLVARATRVAAPLSTPATAWWPEQFHPPQA